MKRVLAFICALSVSTAVLGQEAGEGEPPAPTPAMDETAAPDLLNNYRFQDASSLEGGSFDLRFGSQWWTGSHPGGSADNFILTPSVVWGITDEFELTFGVDAWLGDGNDMGPFEDGNFDSNLRLHWRFHDQVGFEHKEGYLHLPSMALSSTVRIPTGCGSEKMDAELRFIASYEYTSGIRSHFNLFGKSVNGNNLETNRNDDDDVFNFDNSNRGFDFLGLGGADELDDVRDFQYGAILGADGPLNGDGSLRWVADYAFNSSNYDGNGSNHIAEVGFEWEMSDVSRIGMSVQAALDHGGDAPNWGIGLMYAFALGL